MTEFGFEPVCTCGQCDVSRWMHNVRRVGHAAALRHRNAEVFRFEPQASPTLTAADLDLSREFDAATIARIAREAVRVVR